MERTVRRSMRLGESTSPEEKEPGGREENAVAYRKESGQIERGRGDGIVTRR